MSNLSDLYELSCFAESCYKLTDKTHLDKKFYSEAYNNPSQIESLRKKYTVSKKERERIVSEEEARRKFVNCLKSFVSSSFYSTLSRDDILAVRDRALSIFLEPLISFLSSVDCIHVKFVEYRDGFLSSYSKAILDFVYNDMIIAGYGDQSPLFNYYSNFLNDPRDVNSIKSLSDDDCFMLLDTYDRLLKLLSVKNLDFDLIGVLMDRLKLDLNKSSDLFIKETLDVYKGRNTHHSPIITFDHSIDQEIEKVKDRLKQEALAAGVIL